MTEIYKIFVLFACITLLGCASHRTKKMQEAGREKKAELIEEQRLDELRRRMDTLEKKQERLLQEEKALRAETEKQMIETEKLQKMKISEIPKEMSMMPARISVLNGSGRKNAVKKLEVFLSERGYTVSSTGNADHSGYKKSVVTYRDQFRKEAIEIAHKIPGWQDIYRMKEERPDADIVIIIGKELLNKIQ